MPHHQTATTESPHSRHYISKHRLPESRVVAYLGGREMVQLLAAVAISVPSGLVTGNLIRAAITPRPVAAALPAGGIPQPMSEAVPRHRPEKLPEVVPVTAETRGVCSMPEYMQHLLETDCYLLSPIAGAPNMPHFNILRNDKGAITNSEHEFATIGSISTDGMLHADVLPDDYKLALRTALTDPFVAHVVSKYPVTLAVAPNNENGYFISEPGREPNNTGSIRLVFNTSLAQSDRSLYRTWGSIRLVLVHEGAHGDYQRWINMTYNDTEAGRFASYTIEKLESLYWQEINASYNDMLEENTEFYRMQLQNLANSLASGDAAVIDQRIAELMRDNVGEMIKHIDEGCVGDTVSDQDHNNQRAVYDRILSGTEKTYEEMIAVLDGELSDHFVNSGYWYSVKVTDKYGFIREGKTTYGVSDYNAGHPGGAATEMIASMMVTVQGVPDKLINSARTMTPTHRQQLVRMLEALEAMYNYDSPQLGEATNLRYVIANIRAFMSDTTTVLP